MGSIEDHPKDTRSHEEKKIVEEEAEVVEKLPSIFSKVTDVLGSIDKKQAALTGISFAVGGILGVLTDASGILQSMLKLINTGVLLILKPIGDFFGLLFRPIIVALYAWFIVPFYKHVYPALMSLAETLGSNLLDNLAGLGEIFSGNMDDATKRADMNTEKLKESLSKGFEILKKAWGGFVSKLPKGLQWIGKEGEAAIGAFVNFVSGLDMRLLVKGWDAIVGFFQNVGAAVQRIMSASWDKMINMFVRIGNDVLLFIEKNWDTFLRFFSTLSSSVLLMSEALVVFMGFFNTLSTWANAMRLPNIVEIITNLFRGASNNQRSYNDARNKSGGGGGTGGYTDSRDSSDNKDSTSTTTETTSSDDTSGTDTPSTPDTPKRPKYEKKENTRKTVPKIPKSYQDYESRRFGLAEGGIINEPIFGVGKSGRQYLMGESGSELVLPLSKMRGGSNTKSEQTVNITINAQVSNSAQMEQLIRRIKSELQKDTRRTGIV